MTTRTKILKPATIIPASLYVERQADRQLRTVIQDMGRPGYVLVARQMGKTNMLLHARGRIEDPTHQFGYVDFSLPGESLREQLRAIIDAFIDAHTTQFREAANHIREARGNTGLPAHKEHENELRTLLEATTGKIVLIFDEIDALINTNYSDQLFSLVRSIYFSRANFPEYERLTYVLSGVAEPSELIKNKNISPFNIGEKIYLDEFTTDEVQVFLRNAALELSSEVTQRVYYWTEGNPRMTWDVCSALEDELIAQNTVDPKAVDAVVQKLYFGSFDRAPVDHIRTIVADQRDIRDTVAQIRRGEGTIGDQMRAKLYLAGIIASSFSPASPRLKNRVIDAALSNSWLEDVERGKRNALERARDRYSNKQYKEALPLFLEHLSGLSDRDDKAVLYYEIGYCYFDDAQYKDAKMWFEKQPIDPHESLFVHLRETYLLAVCNTYLDQYDQAIANFQKVIDTNRRDSDYFLALVNQAAARILAGGEANLATARDALRQFLADPNQVRGGMPEDEARQIVISARVNFGRALENTGDVTGAISQIEAALDACMAHEKPTLLTRLISLEEDAQKRAKRVRDAMDFVSAYKPVFAKRTASNQMAFDYVSMVDLYGYVIELEDDNHKRFFGEYVRKQYFNDVDSDTQFTFDVAFKAYTAGRHEDCRRELTHYLRRVGNTVPDSVKAVAMKMVLFSNERPEADTMRSQYLALMQKKPYAELDAYDLGVMLDEAGKLFTQRKHEKALKIINIANTYRAKAPKEILPNYIFVDYLEMLLCARSGDQHRATEIAKQLEEVQFESYEGYKSLLFSPEDFGTMKTQAKRILSSHKVPSRVQNPYGDIGRNEFVTVEYKDGRITADKFKRLQTDIASGICRIVGRGRSAVH